MSAPTRERRELWFVDDRFNLQKVTGYRCEGHNDYWWVPMLSVSAQRGVSLFNSHDEALRAARDKCRCTIDRLRNRHRKLEQELRNSEDQTAADEMIDRWANSH